MAKLLTGTRIYGTGTVDTQLFVNGTDQSTSTSTGALVLGGGLGVGGNLYVGGISVLPGVHATNISASGTLGVTGTSILTGVQATNIVASGTLGVTGTTTLSVLNATSATFSGTLGVTGTTTLRILNATSATFSGTLGVTGTSVLAGQTSITNTTSATSTSTGALVVSGGVGIGRDLRVGGIIYGTFNGSITGTATTATNIAGGTAGQVPYQISPGQTGFFGAGTAGNVLVSNGTSAPTYNNVLTLTGTTEATSTATGALQVRGGASVGRDLVVGNKITGLLKSGELLSVGDADDGVDKYISIKSLFGTMQIGRNTNTNAYINSNMAVGLFELIHNSAKIQINASDEVIIPQSTLATSTSTGALRVSGGVGIGRSLFVQESIVQVGGTYSTLAATYNLINTTATTVNFAGAASALTIGATTGSTTVRNNLSVTGNLTVQGTTTIVDSTVTNIADPIITLGGGANNAAPTVDDNKDRGIAFKWVNNGGTTSTGFFGYDDSTGFLTYIQTATITNEVVSGTKGAVDANLAGGAAMSLVYQSAANTTAFLAAGTGGYILQTNGTGSAPSWVAASGIGAGSATNADAIRTVARTTAADHYLTFVDSNNASNAYESLYTTSSFSINPQSGTVNAATFNATSVTGGGFQGIDADTVTQPSFTWSGDLATGMYKPAASAIGFATTGVQRVLIDNTSVYIAVSSQLNTGFTHRLNVNGSIVAGSVSSTGGSILLQGQYGTGALTNFGTEYSSGGPVLSYGVYPSNTATGTFLSSTSVALNRAAYTQSGNSHNWYVGASQTLPIGSTATLSLAMTLNASGALAFNGSTNYGSIGQVLQSNGNAAPTWVTITPGGGTSTQVNTVLQVSNGTYYPTFVDSNNATATSESVYTTSSFSINPSTGAVIHTSNVAASSTNTGALQVVNGGAGIGGNIYAGGDIYSRGRILTPAAVQEFTATGGQTIFTVSGGYAVGTVQVFANGINLGSADIVASNGTTVTLLEPRTAGDIIRITSGGTASTINNIQNFSIAMSIAMSM